MVKQLCGPKYVNVPFIGLVVLWCVVLPYLSLCRRDTVFLRKNDSINTYIHLKLSVHAMTAIRKRKRIAPLILNLGARWRRVVNMIRPLYCRYSNPVPIG